MLVWLGLLAVTLCVVYFLKQRSEREFKEVGNKNAVAKALEHREKSIDETRASLGSVPADIRAQICSLDLPSLVGQSAT